MGIDLQQLLTLDEKNIFNINEYQYQSQQIVCLNSSIEQSENKHELEKANLIIEQLQKEVSYLKDINNLLQK
jgi:hypothetical protein